MTDPGSDRYLLPEDENRRIFLESIVPREMATQEPQEVPTVVFLIGQPGAGKSRLGAILAARLNERGGFVDVDSDLYKPYHPDYSRLLAQDDKLMAAHTRADGRRWMAQAHQHVRDHKLNAVIQETSQDASAVARTMRAYRTAGFRVEALAMAVPAAMSNQGIVNRYYEQVRDRGHGRLTVQKNADESYRGIIELAHLVDDHHLADHVAVFRRGENQPRYSNSLDEQGQWHQAPTFGSALQAERDRPWTEQEAADFQRTQAKLRAGLGPEWEGRLGNIDQSAAPFLSVSAASRAAEHAQAAARPVTRDTDRSLTPTPADTPEQDAARHIAAASRMVAKRPPAANRPGPTTTPGSELGRGRSPSPRPEAER